MIKVIEQIQLKRGRKADLERLLVDNRKPAVGEPIWEIDTNRLKLGNGISNYADLNYIDGTDALNIQVQDPLNNEILMWDAAAQKWQNKKLVNSENFSLTDSGLTIKGFDDAHQGQLLARNLENGLAWVDALTSETLNYALQEIEASVIEATEQSNKAAGSAGEARLQAALAQRINEVTLNRVRSLFWVGTEEEYNALTEINEETIYFIK